MRCTGPRFCWRRASRCRRKSLRMAGGFFRKRKCRNRAGTCSIRSPRRACWVSTRCGIFFCATWYSAGRELHTRHAAHSLQQRSGQWLGQFGVPHPDHDEKYFGGEIPERSSEIDNPLKSACAAESQIVLDAYESYSFSAALQHIWQIISLVDNYLTNEKPWKLAEVPEERKHLASVLYNAAEALRFVVVLAHPVIPQSTRRFGGSLDCRALLNRSGWTR